uniref:F-box/LRR-repeat protein 15/At3g58940/PEG3-like LRR domain-containing protein n=1 Tax=Ixodes ricinus TaxID=34613 RepID=V5GS92_IXORI
MEEVKEFGCPDKLLTEEDLIILKLDKPCSQPFPDNLTVDSTGHLVSMNQKHFIRCETFLGKQHISSALFAGCSAFDSSKRFEKAAELILRNVRTLVVLHNRNLICDLYSKSEHMTSLVLPHNLRVQTANDSSWSPSRGKASKLTKLVGTMPAIGIDHLLIDFIPTAQAVHHCPGLSWIQAPMDAQLSTPPPEVAHIIQETPVVSKRHVILGSHMKTLDGKHFVINAEPKAVVCAQQLFPSVYQLEVTSRDPESLLLIAHFKDVRRLSITASFQPCYFHQYASKLLREFQLEELSLENFEDVPLASLAIFCGNLSSLSVKHCTFKECVPLPASFPNLTYLLIENIIITEVGLRALLSGCKNLITLQINDPKLAVIVKLVPELRLEKLERLVLNTNQTLSSSDVGVDDLKRFLANLPSLRYLATDSYGLRLFFETHAPHVTLAWASCTICTAHFPKVNESQEGTWAELMLKSEDSN